MLKVAFNMGVTNAPYTTFKTMSDIADPSNRAGRYIRQPSGYRAFIPASLPPVPPVRLEGELQFLLSDADRALGRLDGSIQTLPNPDLFVFMYVRKEAVTDVSGGSSLPSSFVRAAANAHRVLEHLYQRPILGVADVRKLTGTTYTAANNLVSRLSNLGIIQETTGNRRNRLFRYEPYIQIFREAPSEAGDNKNGGHE
jgi:hypothetical protein